MVFHLAKHYKKPKLTSFFCNSVLLLELMICRCQIEERGRKYNTFLNCEDGQISHLVDTQHSVGISSENKIVFG